MTNPPTARPHIVPSPLPLSVIVPACNASGSLRKALAAIRASRLSREAYELIVVDDASTDESSIVAARHADTIIRLRGRPCGPAYCRNRGAELAVGEIVAFVDADVIVGPETLGGMMALFADPGLAALSASHSDSAAGQNFVSQYWNLLLHFGEERHAAVGADLASGCSLVRRSALHATGMYDEWRFGTGCLEGLELAQRLKMRGYRVAVSHGHQVSRLKRWTVGSVCREVWNRSKILGRSLGYQQTRTAVPGEVVFTLSRTMTPVLAVATIVALSAAFLPEPSWWLKVSIAVVGVSLANLPVYRFLTRSRGLAFTVAAMPLHLLSQGIAAVALCIGWIQRDIVGDRAPDATTQAYFEVGLETWPPVPRRR